MTQAAHISEPEAETNNYLRMAKAIRFIDAHAGEPISLNDVAAEIGLSPFHFERLFARWAGLSPLQLKRYIAFRSARDALVQGESVLDAAMSAGLSGPGRLHDQSVTFEAMSPGDVRARGRGLVLAHGVHESPFGQALVFTTPRGVAGLAFSDPGEEDAAFADMRGRWPLAEIREAQAETQWVADAIAKAGARVPLHLEGSNLQVKVWEALLAIPPGKITNYSAIAKAAGAPSAVRAVASAIGANPVSYFIPCHRVLRTTGALGGYRWGLARKKTMLAYDRMQTL